MTNTTYSESPWDLIHMITETVNYVTERLPVDRPDEYVHLHPGIDLNTLRDLYEFISSTEYASELISNMLFSKKIKMTANQQLYYNEENND